MLSIIISARLSPLAWLKKRLRAEGADVGVVGHDLHALLSRALEGGRHSIGVVAGDGDHADFLRDESVDELDLRLGGRLRGRLLHNLAADLLLGFFSARLCDLEIGIGVELGKETDRNRVGRQTRRSRQRGSYKHSRNDVGSPHDVVSSDFRRLGADARAGSGLWRFAQVWSRQSWAKPEWRSPTRRAAASRC